MLFAQHDYRNLLLGLIHSNIPGVNDLRAVSNSSLSAGALRVCSSLFPASVAISSLQVYQCDLERPVMYGGLLGIRNKLGGDKFPLIGAACSLSFLLLTVIADQYYYSTAHEMRRVLCLRLLCLLMICHRSDQIYAELPDCRESRARSRWLWSGTRLLFLLLVCWLVCFAACVPGFFLFPLSRFGWELGSLEFLTYFVLFRQDVY